MPNIIDQILQIDSIAQQKLDDAARQKEELEQQAKQKMAETAALIEQKAGERLQKFRREEAARAEDEMAEIKARTESALDRLEQIYQQTHQKLEDEIFANILNGN